MKKKAIEALKPAKTRKKGIIITVQTMDDILILNVWDDKKLLGRHCMNLQTKEYAQWDEKDQSWSIRKFMYMLGGRPPYYFSYTDGSKLKFNTEKEKKMVEDLLKHVSSWKRGAWDLIDELESQYGRERRERIENNRISRVNAMMGRVPKEPDDLREWILKKTGHINYTFYDKEDNKWHCTSCGKTYSAGLVREDGNKEIRHNDMVICPKCKKVVQAVKRTNGKVINTNFVLLQPIDNEVSVARHYDADIRWSKGGITTVISESVRIVLFKKEKGPKHECDIYYNQMSKSQAYLMIRDNEYKGYTSFDNRSNLAKRRIQEEYLYENDKDIEECLKGTAYEAWTRVFQQMSKQNITLEYNRMMAAKNNYNLVGIIEYLYKGRFYKLLKETSGDISYFGQDYCGPLNVNEKTVQGIFGLKEKQNINRIRDNGGGEIMLNWLRRSEKAGKKIPQETLNWLDENNVRYSDVEFIIDRMSPIKIVNYIKRQKKGQYKKLSLKSIIQQWEDYLSMCKRLKMNLHDEMIYKPGDLKRRHDEAIMKIELMQAEIQAEEISEKYPGAEAVLHEIKEKYEYQTDQYFIRVPDRLIEIVAEGRALHHCAGSSDRYFDRIAQRETYICFLRKKEEPDKPYYTIEVEPGGTIRQHRGYLDEEPDIKEIKPFLRKWQQVVRKRLTKEDMRYAEISEIKRQENIEELKAKNNTRVLNALTEDFMEAIG